MSDAQGTYRLVELEAFVPAHPSEGGGQGRRARRFSRLIAEEGASREGATSVVLKVRNAIGEPFALKVMKAPRDATRPAELERAREDAFLEEYHNQLAVSNLRGFPAVYGWGRLQGRPVILMEWVEGTSLHDVLRRTGPWDARRVARLAVATLDILRSTAALERGFVHRDISPRNVLLRTSARGVDEQLEGGDFDVCLVDMGSAVSLSVEDGSFTMLADVWRNATPDYAAPEMLTRDVPGIDALRHSSAIDVYALCSVLYELYSGEPPFRVVDHPEASPYRLKMDARPAPLVARDPRDEGLCELVMAGLAADPGERPTVASLRAAVRAWLEGVTEPRALLVPYQGAGDGPAKGDKDAQDAAPRGHSLTRRTLVAGAAAAGLGIAAWATRGFGLFGRARGLASLSWDDLSEISAEVADAGDEAAAIAVARGYGLVTADGTLDPTQSKPLMVAGSALSAQLAGIAHDARADGSPIGLSFLLTSVLPDERPMSEEAYMGGWEGSDLRAWLNGVLLADLPEELARNIVAAGKHSNNAGAARSAADVTLTEDLLWLPSYVELVGERDRTSFSDGFQYLADTLNAEGSQYKLFRDQGVIVQEAAPELVRSRDGEPAYWWLRSASPDVSESEGMAYFNRTGPNGDPFHYATASTEVSGVLFGFCV